MLSRCGSWTRSPWSRARTGYAATIPDLPFKPGIHVHYQESVLRMRDGLPKMKDLPKEMGGSGDTLPE